MIAKPSFFILFLLVAACDPVHAVDQAADSGTIQFTSSEVTILPGDRFVLVAPSDGKVAKAPQYGKVYGPAEYPDVNPADVPKARLEDEDKAVAVIEYPPSKIDELNKEDALAKRLDALLRNYGQRGIALAPLNLPWSNSSDSRKRDAAYAAVGFIARETLPDGRHDLRDVLRTAKASGTIPDSVRSLIQSIASNAPASVGLTDSDWLEVLESAIVYVLRDEKKLNSAEYGVSFGRAGVGGDEPNMPNANYFGPSFTPFLVFEVPRLLDDNQFGGKNVAIFCRYWKAVSSDDLFSSDDQIFLNQIGRAAKQRDDLPTDLRETVASDWRAAAKSLLEDCDASQSLLQRWRRVEEHVVGYPCDSNYIRNGDQDNVPSEVRVELQAIDNSLSSAEIIALYRGVSNACVLSNAIPQEGRPASSKFATSWVADQYRLPHQFKAGTFMQLLETPGIMAPNMYRTDTSRLSFNSPTHSKYQFVLVGSNIWDPVVVPIEPGGLSWRQLTDKSDAGEKDPFFPRPPVIDPVQPGGHALWRLQAVSKGEPEEVSDPFAPLIIQSLASLLPTIDALVMRESPTAEDLLSAGRLVAIIRAELEGQIGQQAESIRTFARGTLDRSRQAKKLLRDGHIVVPEQSIVDTVSVDKESQVLAGSPVATLHPVFRYRLTAKIPANLSVAKLLLPGTPLRWSLSCDGPVGTTFDQRRLIVDHDGKDEILGWLKVAKTVYLRSHIFAGVIDVVDRDPASLSDDSLLIRVSFEIPEDRRSVLIPFSELGIANAKTVESTMAEVGVRSSATDQSLLTILDAGPLSVGDHCTAVFFLPVGKGVKSVEDNWRRLLEGR